MPRKVKKKPFLTYISIGLVNLCVAVMFTVMLLAVEDKGQIVLASAPVSDSKIGSVLGDISIIEDQTQPIAKISVGTPSRVEVNSVGIDLPVKVGSYDEASKDWYVDDTAAFYADRSVPVNNSNGSTLIYGHAKWGLFERLPDIDDGAEAVVYTENGQAFKYLFISTRHVLPTDVSAVVSSGPPSLILQTCSGPFDAYRTLVTFELREVVKL